MTKSIPRRAYISQLFPGWELPEEFERLSDLLSSAMHRYPQRAVKRKATRAVSAPNTSRYYAHGITPWQGLTLRKPRRATKIPRINSVCSQWPLPRIDRAGRIMRDLFTHGRPNCKIGRSNDATRVSRTAPEHRA